MREFELLVELLVRFRRRCFRLLHLLLVLGSLGRIALVLCFTQSVPLLAEGRVEACGWTFYFGVELFARACDCGIVRGCRLRCVHASHKKTAVLCLLLRLLHLKPGCVAFAHLLLLDQLPCICLLKPFFEGDVCVVKVVVLFLAFEIEALF